MRKRQSGHTGKTDCDFGSKAEATFMLLPGVKSLVFRKKTLTLWFDKTQSEKEIDNRHLITKN